MYIGAFLLSYEVIHPIVLRYFPFSTLFFCFIETDWPLYLKGGGDRGGDCLDLRVNGGE